MTVKIQQDQKDIYKCYFLKATAVIWLLYYLSYYFKKFIDTKNNFFLDLNFSPVFKDSVLQDDCHAQQ